VSLSAALAAIAVGFLAGVASGMFGVGGGIVMTPGVQTFLGASPIVSLATPLPVIFPTAIAGALRYRAADELDLRAARLIVTGGLPAVIVGAVLTEVVPTTALLLVTALLLAWQSIGIVRGKDGRTAPAPERIDVLALLAIGVVAGLVSGLLGIGGGLVVVPLLTRWLGFPLKRALGTSLAAVVGLVVPATIVHAALGNIDWAIAGALAIGAVPGARLGSRLALGAADHTLRLLVGGFMLAVALAYGIQQAMAMIQG